MAPSALAFAAFLVALLAVVAFRARRRRSPFAPGRPAPPRACAAAAALRRSLAALAAEAGGPGLGGLEAPLRRVQGFLAAEPPTYGGLLAVYRGLADSGPLFCGAARSLAAAPEAGARALGKALFELPAAVHALGDSLLLE